MLLVRYVSIYMCEAKIRPQSLKGEGLRTFDLSVGPAAIA